MVEFSLVSVLLVTLVLAIVQLTLALHVRNTLLDAAAEGARYAALAGSSEHAGVARTRELIGRAVADDFARDVSSSRTSIGGLPAIEITVRASLPVIGLIGPADALEVVGHAVIETVD